MPLHGEKPDDWAAPAAAYTRVREIKARLAQLHTRNAEIAAMIRNAEVEQAEVAATIEQTEAELSAAVAAPVAGEEDPTAWLPDELMILILIHVMAIASCSMVCKRWRALCQDKAVVDGLWLARWQPGREAVLTPTPLSGHADKVTAVTVDRHGQIITASYDKHIRVWAESDGRLRQRLTRHRDWVQALVVAEDGVLYSGSDDCTLREWTIAHSEKAGEYSYSRTFEGHVMEVHAVTVGETHVFSGSEDNTVRVWTRGTGEQFRVMRHYRSPIWSLALQQGRGGCLYSGHLDGTICVWSTVGWTVQNTLHGHTDCVNSLLFHGHSLFSGSTDQTVRVWGVASTRPSRILKGHTAEVTALAMAPDGTLCSAAENGTLLMWQANSQLEVACVQPPGPTEIFALTITPRGRLCATGTQVLLW